MYCKTFYTTNGQQNNWDRLKGIDFLFLNKKQEYFLQKFAILLSYSIRVNWGLGAG